MHNNSNSFVSLFSGCGGLDLGFILEGFHCSAAFDIDPIAVSVHRRNLGSPAQLLDLSGEAFPYSASNKPSVLLAGTPCQGFSTAGKRDPKDPRNNLLIRAAEIAIRLSPKVVVIENVAGVIAGEHRRFWDRALSILRGNGYTVAEVRCNAECFGVPQKRCRMVVIAWRNGRHCVVELPRHPGGTLRSALQNLKGTSDHVTMTLDPTSKAAMIARHIGPNQKLCNVRESDRSVHTWYIPSVFGRTNSRERRLLEALLHCRRRDRKRDFGDADPVTASTLARELKTTVGPILATLVEKGYVRKENRLYDLVHTFNGKFRRLVWDEPAPTVDSRFGDPYYFLHPAEHRAFTIRETARIQGFPDTFLFEGHSRHKYRLIANAVPPPLARSVAAFVRDALLR